MLVNWLEDSGWTSALTQGDIASSGRADTFIKAIHVTKTRHTHEITAASLYILLQQAYDVFSTSAILLDGAAVVQTLNPGTATTFQDYADSMFERFVSSQIANASRVDVVWDAYLPGSLKATIRKKRGKSVRGRVFPSNDMPKNWKGFLRDDNNKTELFTFLAQQVSGITVEESKVIFATSEQNVLCSSCETNLSNVPPCSQEEADARLILHAADAGKKQDTYSHSRYRCCCVSSKFL